jgi:hypothetical protein
MSESPSLYETAMAELDVDVTPGEYIQMLGPDRIREKAAECLWAEGVEIASSPSLVNWALDRKCEEVVSDLYQWLEELQARTKRGRPQNGVLHNLILVAAYSTARSAGHGKTEARRAAAKRLGEPITKDKVERAEKLLLRDAGRAFASVSKERAIEIIASQVMTVQAELARIEEGMEAERRDDEGARHKRRFYVPAGDCFRAESSSNVVGPQR